LLNGGAQDSILPSAFRAALHSFHCRRAISKGLPPHRLAKFVGVTFQQVQKYEAGTNRMGSSRLYQMSLALSVPVSYFFEDMPQQEEPQGIRGFAETE
jgi:transcriptional regulator with XRE-family HTH domain